MKMCHKTETFAKCGLLYARWSNSVIWNISIFIRKIERAFFITSLLSPLSQNIEITVMFDFLEFSLTPKYRRIQSALFLKRSFHVRMRYDGDSRGRSPRAVRRLRVLSTLSRIIGWSTKKRQTSRMDLWNGAVSTGNSGVKNIDKQER